ncbi:DUF6438 domain-containing protein [Kushneria marisflavi]|uniref:DUF6438 domain-containing protein n=1 Tax=Kushneria marisflavi TaxID=157779 RepID=A0A240UPC1_9GAMM|nr:DUF6438 domain-containing protein [Kushneria marisflavi]ART63331.1 hypothetical protein B9H00_09885 [Kushneria marisflavi]RKD84372.1 hypothetical protein C8D96_2430 [Kushneria marisflavi]
MNTFLRFALLAGAVVLAGCAGDENQMHSKGPHDSTAPAAEQLASIRYDVGPCHGFCPVYSVEVRADGTTTFIGQQHTQVYGKQARQNGAQALTRLQRTLAPWQPVMNQQRESSGCEPRVTDMSQYTVTWTGRDGRQATLLHDGGCRSASALSLTHLLREEIPQTLGISNWIGTPSSNAVTTPVN